VSCLSEEVDVIPFYHVSVGVLGVLALVFGWVRVFLAYCTFYGGFIHWRCGAIFHCYTACIAFSLLDIAHCIGRIVTLQQKYLFVNWLLYCKPKALAPFFE